MGTYINERGAVCYRSSTQDGHGGHAREHHEEMRQIAQEEIKKAIPDIERQAYERAINDLLEALRADITTIVDIALESGESIFHDSRTRQALYNHVYNEIKKNLNRSYTIW